MDRGFCTSCEDWFYNKTDVFYIRHRSRCASCYRIRQQKDNIERKEKEAEKKRLLYPAQRIITPAERRANLISPNGKYNGLPKGICKYCDSIDLKPTYTVCAPCRSKKAQEVGNHIRDLWAANYLKEQGRAKKSAGRA